MAFVKYSLKTKSITPRASIKPTGIISFNSAARAIYKLDSQLYAVLYYDANTQQIGVELTSNGKADGARKVRLRPSGADVSIRGFAEFFGLDLSAPMTVDVGKDARTGYLTLGLRSAKPKAGRPRMTA